MFTKTLSIITLGAFVTMHAVPAMADDFDRHMLPHFNTYGQFDHSSRATARIYIRIPFSGGLKRSVSKTRFGLSLTSNRKGHYNFTSGFAPSDTPKLIDLSIGLSGSDSFRFNGISLDALSALNADETRKNTKVWPFVLLGVTAAAGTLFFIELDKAFECGLIRCPKD